MTEQRGNSRKPRAFRLDEVTSEPPRRGNESPGKPATKPTKMARKPQAIRNTAILTPIPDEAALTEYAGQSIAPDDLTPPPAKPMNGGFSWGRWVIGALGGLMTLGIGLYIDQLVRDLFAANTILGSIALGLTLVLIIALIALSIENCGNFAPAQDRKTARRR